MNKIFAIIPAYNESPSIQKVVSGVKKYVDEIVVIDDGSSDNTALRARRAGAIVIRHLINRGQGAALQTGTNFAIKAGADILVHFDADGQMEPSDIPSLLAPIQKGECGIALGSRFLNTHNKIPLIKKIIHKTTLQFHWLISGIRLSDVHCGFRALSLRAAQSIYIYQDRMAHATEIEECIAQNRITFKEIPITVYYTSYSRAKAAPIMGHIWQIVRDVVIGRIIKS